MKLPFTIFLIATCAITTGARGQNIVNSPTPMFCPQPHEIAPVHLYGRWQAEFEGLGQEATLVFERHPELTGSISGTIELQGVKAQLAGDVDEGEFTLEESNDGKRISATWLGTVVDQSCGKEIKGLWNNDSTQVERAFILRKLPGWQ